MKKVEPPKTAGASRQGARNNCFRDGFVHVMEKACPTCIFRPGNKMHLAAGRVESMVASAKGADAAIVCHSTLFTSENAVCRGFADRYATMPLRLATLMDKVKLQKYTPARSARPQAGSHPSLSEGTP